MEEGEQSRSALAGLAEARCIYLLPSWCSLLPHRLGAQYLYPMVQPVADPAISKVSNSKVVKEVVDYWSPHAAPAPAPAAPAPPAPTRPPPAHNAVAQPVAAH